MKREKKEQKLRGISEESASARRKNRKNSILSKSISSP